MTVKEAEKVLEIFDIQAPANINWNQKDLWIKAIVAGYEAVEKSREEVKTDEEKA